MSRWYRAYEGTVTDPKLGEAAMIAGVSRSVSIAAWHSLLESAAGRNNCGSFDATPRRVAVILCEPLTQIEALFSAYEELGLIAEAAVTSWKRRQYESDNSTERSRKHRNAKRNVDATLQQRDATPPDTETDTEEGEATASPRGRTQGKRLSDDWEPKTLSSDTVSGQIIAARGHDWAARALESFRNHWRSANGPNARKRDWQAAWANWIIEQDNRDGRRNLSVGRHQPTDGLSPTTRAARDVFGIGASH